MGGVDVGEKWLILVEHWFCRGETHRLCCMCVCVSLETPEMHSPLPWVLASIISLMRPEPTLFLAANLTLYQVPQRRLSNLNDLSVELINTSLHSSVLSTEYCSTNAAEPTKRTALHQSAGFLEKQSLVLL